MRARCRLDLAGIRFAVAPAARAGGHLRGPVRFYVAACVKGRTRSADRGPIAPPVVAARTLPHW
jgi:hypothetical protein